MHGICLKSHNTRNFNFSILHNSNSHHHTEALGKSAK